MCDLRAHGVDVVTIGQYLQPSPKHAEIDRWVHPDEFRWFREQGEALGFGSVFSVHLVCSSHPATSSGTRPRRDAEQSPLFSRPALSEGELDQPSICANPLLDATQGRGAFHELVLQ